MGTANRHSFGFSEYWRKNKASTELQELTKALLALRKVGRHIASNIKEIEWEGMSPPHSKKIALDMGLAKGEYPIPPGKIDILVGITARGAFHCKILSDIVWLKLKKKISLTHPNDEYLLHLLADIGEDIFTKHLTHNTVWKHYLDFSWSRIRQASRRNPADPPTVETLLLIFAEYALSDKLAINMNSSYHDLFDMLIAARDQIIACETETSISKRCNIRVEIYRRLWEELEAAVKKWEAEKEKALLQKDDEEVNEFDQLFSIDEDSKEIQGDTNPVAKESDLKLLQDIKAALEEHEGKIMLTSEPGKGTRVEVILPVVSG